MKTIFNRNPADIFRQLVVNLFRTDYGKKVTVTGWISSGSTFIYQVLKEMGVNVAKKHTISRFDRYSGRIIYTIRDPRDVIVSTAKRHFHQVFETEGINKAIDTAIDYFNESLQTHISSSVLFASKNCLLIRYENFFSSNEFIMVRFLADIFNHNLRNDEIDRIVRKFSIEENIRRSGNIKNFEHMDRESLLHGNHISNKGQAGVYKTYFSHDNALKFNRVLGHLLLDFGYEADLGWADSFTRKVTDEKFDKKDL